MIPLLAAASALDGLGALWKGLGAASPASASDAGTPSPSGAVSAKNPAAQNFAALLSAHGIDAGADAARLAHAAAGHAAT